MNEEKATAGKITTYRRTVLIAAAIGAFIPPLTHAVGRSLVHWDPNFEVLWVLNLITAMLWPIIVMYLTEMGFAYAAWIWWAIAFAMLFNAGLYAFLASLYGRGKKLMVLVIIGLYWSFLLASGFI